MLLLDYHLPSGKGSALLTVPGVSIPRHVVVLSGFRAPYYNQRGLGEGMARAASSRTGGATVTPVPRRIQEWKIRLTNLPAETVSGTY